MRKIYTTILSLSLCFVFLFSTTAYAAAIDEAETNDSPSTAQLIQANNEDPSKIISGNYDGQNVVVGNITSTADEDWYKVYLPANSDTILGINSSSLSGSSLFEVYDENLNLVRGVPYVSNSAYFGATPFYVNIPTSGYYYVKVSSTLLTGEYRFYIGGPDYALNSYTYNATSAVTLTPTIKSVQATYDLTNITSIPRDAVVYYVSLQGTKVNNATNQYRSIKVAGDSTWINTSSYTYVANVPAISNKRVRNQWTFKLDGTVSTSTKYFNLTPQIKFSYIYPVLPQ